MTGPTAFLDSNVVVSSIFSERGAAHQLVFGTEVPRVISSRVQKECTEAIRRAGTTSDNLVAAFYHLEVVDDQSNEEEYLPFVLDTDDAHIIAGAVAAEADFLITYNLRHYRIDKIRSELGIIIHTPGRFLQYLRSV